MTVATGAVVVGVGMAAMAGTAMFEADVLFDDAPPLPDIGRTVRVIHPGHASGPGDVAVLTTPPAFRWVHLKYCLEKGVNVFMEKPVTVDGPSTRKILALADEADRKGLKIGVGQG